jgi:hypothetical protein
MYGFLLAQSLSNMAIGIFTLRQQLRGLLSKNWGGPWGSSYAGNFNGSSQYLSLPSIAGYTLNADFTIEFWANFNNFNSTGGGSPCPLSSTNTSNNWLVIVDSGTIAFYWNGASIVSASPSNQTGYWYHIAIVRSGSTVSIYRNGVSIASATNASSFTNTSPLFIGQQNTSTGYVNGSISNVRIVKGTAVYTANFQVPTSPLTAISGTQLLTLQNATIIDNSSNAATITNSGTVTTQSTQPFNPIIKTSYVEYLVVGGGGGGGSEAGGGAGGLLTGLLPVVTGATNNVTVGGGGTGGAPGTNGSNSVLNSLTAVGGGGGGNNTAGVAGGSGSGGATSSSPTGGGGQGVFGQGNAGGGGANNAFNAAGGGGGAGTVGLASSTGPTGGNGGAGISSAISGTVTPYAGGGGGSGNTGTQGAGGVGGGGAGSNSAAATAGQANTGGGGGGSWSGTRGAGGSGIVIVSYPDIYAPLTTGGATSPTVSTSGSGSIFCNGSSYFGYNAQTPLVFGSGDFTIEFWIYYTSTPDVILDWRQSGGGVTPVPTIYYNASALKYFVNGTDQIVGGSLSASTWYHVAICKISNVTKMYINGTQSGSNYSDTNTYLVGSGRPVVAANGSSPGSAGSYYLSNIRLVKGVGVYTGAFTSYVPTAPLTATQPAGPSGSNIAAITSTSTSLLLNSNSGSFLADSSTNSYAATSVTGTPAWNQLSPFATGLGYKNRVYTWVNSGGAGTSATGTFTV